jgi:hypothetical protein
MVVQLLEEKPKNLLLPTSIINKDKRGFVIVDKHFFNYKKLLISGIYTHNKSPMVLRNQIFYKAFDFIKHFPEYGKVSSDGDHVYLDFINNFNIDIKNPTEDIKNDLIIIYEYDIETKKVLVKKAYCKLDYKINRSFSFETTKQTTIKFNKLKVYSILNYNSMLLNIVNDIVKILYISLMNPETGLCVIHSPEIYNRFARFQKIWPEFKSVFHISNKLCYLYVDYFKNPELSPGIYQVTRYFDQKNVNIRFVYDEIEIV